MKRSLRLLIRLYPAWWRHRYGKELEALLEDSGSGSRDVWDLLRGAMEMQMKTWSFARIVIVCGIAGVLLAGLVAFSMPYRYRSTAIIKSTPADAAALDGIVTAAFTPQALSAIVSQEHLYADTPNQDSVAHLRRTISVERVAPDVILVSFSQSEPLPARQVTQELVSRILSANATQPRTSPNGMRLELTVRADQPKRQIEYKRFGLAGLGLPAGLLFGVVLALILRRRAPIR
jgi:hypothetical protein